MYRRERKHRPRQACCDAAVVRAQNEVTDAVLARCDARDALKEMISGIMDHEKRGTPWRRGDRWYYYHNSGLQNQYVMFTCDSPGAAGKVFFDPNTLSEDGTVALGTVAFSPDGVPSLSVLPF